MIVALKIDVDTLRGTREGVPKLVDLLKMHDAGASFFFSVGPDRTGRAIRRVFRPGFMRKVQRTSVVQHYGVRTLLYGTLLPGPDIGRRADDVMRHVRDEGFEVGLHSWDHTGWQDGVGDADAAWTGRQMQLGCERFTEIFKEAPRLGARAAYRGMEGSGLCADVDAHAVRKAAAAGAAAARGRAWQRAGKKRHLARPGRGLSGRCRSCPGGLRLEPGAGANGFTRTETNNAEQ